MHQQGVAAVLPTGLWCLGRSLLAPADTVFLQAAPETGSPCPGRHVGPGATRLLLPCLDPGKPNDPAP